jgi:four helix bundle protein
MKVKHYQELIVWQKAMNLAEEVYKISRNFPREEIYGLTSQLRRAAISIPSNVAEGQGRRTTADFLRHLSIAYGSLLELETQVLIAARLSYLTKEKCQDIMKLAAEVGRLLNGLMSSLAR